MARDYGRIFTNFWNSPDIRPLTDQGKLLATYLLTSPHSNIVGAYLLPDSYLGDDMGWPAETVTQTLHELFRKGFCQRFADRRHIAICRYLAWNPIENGNVLKAAFKQADALPDDPALFHVVKGLEPYAKRFGEGSERVWQTLVKRLPEPFRNMEMEMEPEMEPEPEPQRTPALAPPSSRAKPVTTRPARVGKSSQETDPDFDLFWPVYPRHDDKKRALKVWPAALKRAGSLAKLLAGAERYAAERKGEPPQFTKLATTWLNNDCWENAPKTNGHAVPAADPDWTLGETDLALCKIFGAVATDTLIFKRNGGWPGFLHGPKPDDPKNKVDPVVLSRHGYADPAIFQAWKTDMERQRGPFES